MMRDTLSYLHLQPAFDLSIISKSTQGIAVDLQGFQSALLFLQWQQTGEGHSAENTLQILLEEGAALDAMKEANPLFLKGFKPLRAELVQSHTKDLTPKTLTLGYYGSSRFLRLRAVLEGQSETSVSGIFILGHPSLSPQQQAQ